MKKILKVEVKKIPIVTYKYDYSFIDNKGFKVVVENLPGMAEVERTIKEKLKYLSCTGFKIKVKKILCSNK